MDPAEPRPRCAPALHRLPSRLEDDRHSGDAGRDADARARDRTARRAQLCLHRQRARLRRRLDVLPVVREAGDRARLVSHRRLSRAARRRLRVLRHADPRPLRQIRAAVWAAPHPRASRARLSPGSGAWLAALCTSRVLAATWFVAYSAVLPHTQQAWGLSAREAGMIQAAFHLGYLTSLFIVGFIADHFGAKRAYLTTGVAACASPWVFVLFADGFTSALWLHAFTGLCQGGT